MNAITNQPPIADILPLHAFELPAAFVKPAVDACRLFNTLLDSVFYDVPDLVADLPRPGVLRPTAVAPRPARPGRYGCRRSLAWT